MTTLFKPKLQEQLKLDIEHHLVSFKALPCVVVIHQLSDWSVIYMTDRGLKLLNTTIEDITSITSEEYHQRYFNLADAQDYVPKILGLLERNNNDEMVTFFQQVRFPGVDDWNWHMSSTKIFKQDDEGKPSHTITIAVPIDAMHQMTAKAVRLLEENNFLRKNANSFSKLTNREKQVLKLTALGKSANEIACELFISINTAETHRRNIKQKLDAPTSFELSQYARAFDLI
jgi:DNA-binding CsgD family transcriptional regulator